MAKKNSKNYPQKSGTEKAKKVLEKLDQLKKHAKLGLQLEVKEKGTKLVLETFNIESINEGLAKLYNESKSKANIFGKISTRTGNLGVNITTRMATYGFQTKSKSRNTSLDSSAFMSDQTDAEQSDSEFVSKRMRSSAGEQLHKNSQEEFEFKTPLAVPHIIKQTNEFEPTPGPSNTNPMSDKKTKKKKKRKLQFNETSTAPTNDTDTNTRSPKSPDSVEIIDDFLGGKLQIVESDDKEQRVVEHKDHDIENIPTINVNTDNEIEQITPEIEQGADTNIDTNSVNYENQQRVVDQNLIDGQNPKISRGSLRPYEVTHSHQTRRPLDMDYSLRQLSSFRQR